MSKVWCFCFNELWNAVSEGWCFCFNELWNAVSEDWWASKTRPTLQGLGWVPFLRSRFCVEFAGSFCGGFDGVHQDSSHAASFEFV